MDGIACGEPLHWPCALTPLNHTLPPPWPSPLSGAQAALYLLFPLLTAVAVLAIWFRPHLALLGQQFLAGAEGMRRPPPAQPPQIPLQIAREQEQPLPVIAIWDEDHLTAMVGAIHGSLDAHQIRRPLPRRPRRSADSSDSDPSSSDDENNQLRSLEASITKHLSIADLDAGDFRLIVPAKLLHLQDVLAPLPEAERFHALPSICRRFSDVIENEWILHDYSASTDLSPESVLDLVRKLIITTKLLCGMWCQLDKQNWQFCQELKKAYFAHVSDACIKGLLEVASSVSIVHIEQMVPIFDILVDAVCKIRDISFTRSEFINKVADIFHNMVNAFRGQLENRSDKSAPATFLLVQALKFFHRNKDVQAIVGTGHIIDLLDCWAAKLKEDAQQYYDEKDRQYIYILNKMYVVRQMSCHPEGFLCEEQEGRIDSLIQHNTDEFLNGYRVLVQNYLEGDPPRHSALDRFIGELGRKCHEQMTWKVATELKKILRNRISKIVIPPYKRCLLALQETPSPANFQIKQFFPHNRKKKKVIDRSGELRNMFENLFER